MMIDDGPGGGRGRGRGFGARGPGDRGGGRFGGGSRRGGPRGGPDGFDDIGVRRRRLFNSGELQLVLLRLIADSPRHGYDLIRGVEELTGGAYAPSPGIVYPTLTLLTEMGLVAELAADGPRKLFTLTDEGSAQLDAKKLEIEGIMARLTALADRQERTDSVPVKRAVHNLRNVLQHKLASGLADDRLHAAVALIDEVAQKIERL